MLNVTEWMKLSAAAVGGSTMAIMILLILYNNVANDESGLPVQGGGNGLGDGSTYTTIAPEVITLSEAAIVSSTCRKVVMILAKRLMKHLSVCSKELKKQYPTQEEFSKHFQCSIKCFMKKVNLIDETDQITNNTITSFMQVQIPERYQSIMYRLGKPCLDHYLGKLDLNDPLCTSHGDVLKCLQNTIADNC